MRKIIVYILSTVLPSLFLFSLNSYGGVHLKNCDKLTPEQRGIADEIMSKVYLYDCCDKTIKGCLKEKKVCKLAVRLGNEVCTRVLRGQSANEIKRALERRAKSMMLSARKFAIDTTPIDTWLGKGQAKVTLVVYLCARCPFCSKIIPKLHREITKGRLKGKVKMYVRIFPIKSHTNSIPANLAMAAAARAGKFWSYLLKLYKEFNNFSVERLLPWAKEMGIEPARFKKLMESQEIRKIVVDSKKEGLRNLVDGTPTFYINGRKYYGDHSINFFVDALEEEYDRMTGSIYVE